MSEHDLEKLLGGFAADTLTPEEKQRLYSAALQDQQLFDVLADEQALKELLADPDVRRKLLASLEQKYPSGAGGSLSWLDWFRRPAGLASAGGLAAAALAVVLGTRIYQDSLKHAAQSVSTEEAKPTALPASIPPVTEPTQSQPAEPLQKAKDNAEPAKASPTKDVLADKIAKRERSTTLPVPPQEQRADQSARDAVKQSSERVEARRQLNAPVAALGKAAEEVTEPGDQKLTAHTEPPTVLPEPKPMQAPVGGIISGALAPAVSARSLFYGGEPARSEAGMMAQEEKRAMKPLAESAPQTGRPEGKNDQFALAGKARGAATQPKPLGLRYSFVLRGTDGQEREVDAAMASRDAGQVLLTVEANQDAYLQIWKTVGPSRPQLLFPNKESGQISVRILAGQRQAVPLPTEIGPAILTARLSRIPFEPITKQEAAIFDRPSPHQLQESIGGAASSQEQATYVVNQDPSPTPQLSVEIPLGSH